MSHVPHLNQGGSDFRGSVVAEHVDQGNKTYNRDNTNYITNNYYGPGSSQLEDQNQEPRGQKRKSDDDQGQVDQNRYHILLESLRFKQIDARYENIKRAHGKTCKWLLTRPEYLDWLNPDKVHDHHGFLWVKGKPGAGKSTLMKFILSTAQAKIKDQVITSFFFNARGEKLEKSTFGMYRSLLLQLLERLPRLQRLLKPMLSLGINENHSWSVESLKGIFEEAVQNLEDSSLIIFIDALDECDEAEIRNMISFFEDLGSLAISAGTKLHVCFASRHYPHITISKKIELVLEGQEGHEQDIINYLDSELKIGKNKVANEIRAQVKEKASGVFMWVVLVVGILQREHDHGRNHKLKQKLGELPRDLHELFRDTLTRDEDNKDELLLCIQWLLFARRPLRPEQLYFAIRSGEDTTIYPWDREEIPESSITKFILSSSKGLAETTKSTNEPTVQFIHESIRDFLLKENGLKDVWPNANPNLQAEGHQRLTQCCLDYTSAYTSFMETSPEVAPLGPDTADKDFPFLRYAVYNVLYHANAAQEWGVNQTNFLRTFPLIDWIHLDNFFEKTKVHRYTPEASLLYILAEQNLAQLIGVYSCRQSCFRVENERYGASILAAVATSSQATVSKLLKRETRDEPFTSPLHDLCDQYYLDSNQRGLGPQFEYSKEQTLLSYLVQIGDNALISFALALDKPNTNLEGRDSNGRTALSLAASRRSSHIVQKLLDIGAFLDTADNFGRTPLSHAASAYDEPTVRLLIEKGANIRRADERGFIPFSYAMVRSGVFLPRLLNHTIIDKPDSEGRTPLMLATTMCHVDTMMLLLDRGANINKVDNHGRTVLMYAAQASKASTVKLELVIDQSTDINQADNDGHTALLHTAKRPYLDGPTRLLIDRGAWVDITDTTNGRTILSYAAASHYPDIVHSLLDQGVPIDKACAIGRTPLSYAAESNRPGPTVEPLLSRGAAANVPDVNGRTPLSYAVSVYQNDSAVRLLLDYGADVHFADNNGWTPLSYAASSSIEQLLRLQSPA